MTLKKCFTIMFFTEQHPNFTLKCVDPEVVVQTITVQPRS